MIVKVNDLLKVNQLFDLTNQVWRYNVTSNLICQIKQLVNYNSLLDQWKRLYNWILILFITEARTSEYCLGVRINYSYVFISNFDQSGAWILTVLEFSFCGSDQSHSWVLDLTNHVLGYISGWSNFKMQACGWSITVHFI